MVYAGSNSLLDDVVETWTLPTRSYIGKHWRGELSLVQSYWLNLTFGVASFSLLMALLIGLISSRFDDLRVLSAGWILFWPTAMLAWHWGLVGVWRSATKKAILGPPSGWTTVAKAVVILGFLSMAGQITRSAIPQIWEHWRILTGDDSLGQKAKITFSSDRTNIAINGRLAAGSYGDFLDALSSAPNANVIVLNSAGGRIYEAQLIADKVRQNRLNTYVEGRCESACTLILLAGSDRAATSNAKIGFHQPDFPGLDDEMRKAAIATNRETYIRVGVAENFVNRAMATKPDSMWYPTYNEMVAAGVLNRLSQGGETTAMYSSVTSKAQLEAILARTSPTKSIKERYPDIFQNVVTATWNAKVAGMSDAEVSTAGRQEMIKSIPKIIAGADDEVLQKYLEVILEQLNFVQKIGAPACSSFLQGKLNAVGVLPREMLAREIALLDSALQGPIIQVNVDAKEKGEKAIRRAAANLNSAQIATLSGNNPSTKCEATIALYTQVQGLPKGDAAAALRYAFSQ